MSPLTKNDRLAASALTIGGAGGGDVGTEEDLFREQIWGRIDFQLILALLWTAAILPVDGNFDTQYFGFNLAYVWKLLLRIKRSSFEEQTI